MNLVVGDLKQAQKWLTDGDWLVFSFEGGFCQFLEYNYFEPGTSKNGEFEAMILPTTNGLSFWFRIKDTRQNRENLKEALTLVYGPLKSNFDDELEKLQKKLRSSWRRR